LCNWTSSDPLLVLFEALECTQHFEHFFRLQLPLQCHEFVIMLLDYYRIDTIPLHDDRTSLILLSIVNKLSDSWILTMHCKPSSCLWAGYNMDKRFQCQILLFSIVHIISEFLETCNGSQTKPPSVSWIQYDWEFPIPELTVVSCP